MSSFYAAAAAIVENKDGEVLMVQEGKDHVHETWDFPGGGWEDKESIIECVKREVLEETGYSVEIEGFLGVYKENLLEDHPETIVFMFEAEIKDDEHDGQVNDGEILDHGFFAPEEIDDLELRDENRREILDRYRSGESYPIESLWNKLNLLE